MVKIVYVDSRYIRFLYNVDNRVMYNKGQRRPYIGILFEVRGHKYYAPLTHPKEKFKEMKNMPDFLKIKGGTLGAINFNNMIPVVKECVTPLKASEIADSKYKMLLISQMDFFDKNATTIVDKATKLYQSYISKKLFKPIADRCCNFRLLEKQSKKYNPNFKYDPKKDKNLKK